MTDHLRPISDHIRSAIRNLQRGRSIAALWTEHLGDRLDSPLTEADVLALLRVLAETSGHQNRPTRSSLTREVMQEAEREGLTAKQLAQRMKLTESGVRLAAKKHGTTLAKGYPGPRSK